VAGFVLNVVVVLVVVDDDVGVNPVVVVVAVSFVLAVASDGTATRNEPVTAQPKTIASKGRRRSQMCGDNFTADHITWCEIPFRCSRSPSSTFSRAITAGHDQRRVPIGLPLDFWPEPRASVVEGRSPM